MKLISWNCQGAFRKKAHLLLQKQFDIIVVQECECPEKLIFKPMYQEATDTLWFGDNLHKGLGIFSYSHYKFQVSDAYNPDIKFVVPIFVTGGKFDFILFAIWTNHPKDNDGQHIEQVWKAIHYYDFLLEDHAAVLMGDFNSNTIWDKNHKKGNHSMVVEKLASQDIYSLYHLHLNEIQGKETTPTLYMYRKKERPYHIDYCFASMSIADQLKTLEIGKHDDWITASDHMPLFIEF